MLSRAALVVIGALFAQSALASTCSRNYTVALGDTCDGISQANNVSTYQLAVLNPNIDSGCTNLALGQPLCLGAEGSDCQKTHTVVSGDICGAVTDRYAINATLLWANNPQLDADCSNLYIGEVVCVDDKYNVPAVPSGQTPPSTSVPAGVEGAKPQRVASTTSSPVATSTTSAAPTATAAVGNPASSPSSDEDDLPWCADGDDGW